MATAKGLFTPINPEKYMGDPSKIRYLSKWEQRFMNFCDLNPSVIQWGSEELKINYFNPFKKKVCTYFPDFILKYEDAGGNIKTEVVEVKPVKETAIRSKMTTYDKVQLVINGAKWKAARIFCDKYGITFRVMTEAGSFTVDHNGVAVPLTEIGLFRK